MAITVKVVERPVDDVSYIRATLRGMALTVKHLFDVNGRVTNARADAIAITPNK
jgi:hypothetical protein